jgi:hypothetical protein
MTGSHCDLFKSLFRRAIHRPPGRIFGNRPFLKSDFRIYRHTDYVRVYVRVQLKSSTCAVKKQYVFEKKRSSLVEKTIYKGHFLILIVLSTEIGLAELPAADESSLM